MHASLQGAVDRPARIRGKRLGGALGLATLLTTGFFCLFAVVLNQPQILFHYSVASGNIVLYADEPFPPEAGVRVLSAAQRRLALTPLYSEHGNYNVFICNSRWRRFIFFNKDYGVGGVAQYPATPHVFLTAAAIDRNRILSSRGTPVMDDRTLDYFIAHEIVHQVTGRKLGAVRWLMLPAWVREGYADYIARGSSFDYARERQAFFADMPEMDVRKSGLYRRFQLLTTFLLDRRQWNLDELLLHSPDELAVEDAVRYDSTDSAPAGEDGDLLR